MKKKTFIALFLLTSLVIAGWFWLGGEEVDSQVNSFEECVLAGYPVMESYPRQCRTSEGRLFVEGIEDEDRTKDNKDGCVRGGCSSELCVEEDKQNDIASTCEWKEEYACFRHAECERQENGECGWTETPELRECLQGENISGEGLVSYNVPFTPQAPLGNWSDPRQQDGCEEAAALMAVSWARGESFTLQEAEQEIIAISDYTNNKYGEYRDLSAKDAVEWVYKDYFKFNNVSLSYNISIEDIKRELYNGNLVVVPADGRVLNNPYFNPPGPENHMFVIVGYDPDTREFIAHDNGTRRGEDFRYGENTIAQALKDYPTGYHEPTSNFQTAMIVISK